MTEFLNQLASDLAATSSLELVAVIFGVFYILLATRQNIWCWPAALVSTGTSVVLFWDGRLLMESALNVYYLLMAVYGWWQWRYGGAQKDGASIRSFNVSEHFIALLLIAILTLGSGFLLLKNTDAALPFLDSFTTWAAVITTWMVAHKILQNWLYWIVINSVSIFLYLERGFALYAALFVVYIVLSVIGYAKWKSSRSIAYG